MEPDDTDQKGNGIDPVIFTGKAENVLTGHPMEQTVEQPEYKVIPVQAVRRAPTPTERGLFVCAHITAGQPSFFLILAYTA